MSALAPVLESYFVAHLPQRGVSAHTVASYRDTWRLLLGFCANRLGKPPASIEIADLDATVIGAFIDHLVIERKNSERTTNARLGAIRSFFRYAALRCPEDAGVVRRVIAMPSKRPRQTMVTFLTRDEAEVLVSAPDLTTVAGRRDRALLLMAVQTGLRVAELTGLRRGDVSLGPGAHVRCEGKGRKQRTTPLTGAVAKVVRDWLDEFPGQSEDPLFPSRTGGRLSTDAVEDLVDKHVATASRVLASLGKKRVTPHTLRHTCAMNLLHAGVDTSTIALWLGHANIQATQIYLHADLAAKERALARTAPSAAARARYRPPDRLIAFLEAL